jgi:hypothetical protein
MSIREVATDGSGSFYKRGKLTDIGFAVDNSGPEPTYSLTGMTGDQFRHLYFSVVEYKQLLIKQLGEFPSLEDEMFAADYLQVLVKLRNDMLNAFGEELGL